MVFLVNELFKSPWELLENTERRKTKQVTVKIKNWKVYVEGLCVWVCISKALQSQFKQHEIINPVN